MKLESQKKVMMRRTTRRTLLSGGIIGIVSLCAERFGVRAVAQQNKPARKKNLKGQISNKKKENTMVKNYTVLRKRPEMTKEQFYDQWQHMLAPLFAKVPGLTKYTLYFAHTQPSPAFPAVDDPIDGIAETWWASPEAVQAALKTPEFQAAMTEEKRLFGGSDHFTHLVLVDQEISVV